MAERFLIRDLVKVESVPLLESTVKKVKRDEALKVKKDSAIAEKRKERALQRHKLKLRTYGYESEYRKANAELVALRRKAKAEGGFFKEPDSKIIFAIRIKGINKLAPKPRKILQLFRLRQLHNGVFIRVNKATTEMLKCIQPFITYGYPSLRTIRNLIYKRGYGTVGKLGSYQRVRLTENSTISESLGKYGIHGVEDLIHEIYSCGPNFKQAAHFLWPFKLSSPRKGFVAKRHGFNEPRGGDWGNREELINELLNRMN